MPSIKMKTKLNPGCLSEKNGLRICQKPSMISKKTCSRVRISELTAEIDSCPQKCEDVSMSMPVFSNDSGIDEAVAGEGMPDDGISQLQRQPSISVDSVAMDRMDFPLPSLSDMETIFSPILETFELQRESNTYIYEGSNGEPYMSLLGAEASFNNRSSQDYQTCDVSDFYVSDMILSGLPFNMNADISDINCFHSYKYVETSMLFDITDQYMILPFLEDTIKVSNLSDVKFCEEALTCVANADICHAIEQMKSMNQDSNLISGSDQAESFDPQLFIKNLPELSDVVSNFQPNSFPRETQIKKAVTLVLDLDETLVHSTLDYLDDKDFSFTVFFNMKEQIVCVKKRPYLHIFLGRVAEMFELVIFTASQSIYAEQVLNRIDPEGRLISRRVYRESCIFSDGSYTKDLTVLGIDLAKVVIIDNNPQVFRLQVNNGIPIKSWFDDPTDSSLLSLLPFLETLVDVEDVRPIIARRFGNKE